MIKIVDKKNCCGCTACAAVCPKKCIKMTEDHEGFLYPEINTDKCVNCKVCEKVCPISNLSKEEMYEQKAYIVQNKDEKVLRESTAGGAFTAIARYVLQQGGVVFGVEMSEDLVARHVYVEKEEELVKFRNSKYVQSVVGMSTFRKVAEILKQKRMVCFSGTPCQIEGLKKYLNKAYENLVTVDVVCRAVPSPLIFRKYVEYQNSKLSDTIKKIRFRDKYYGYKYSTLNLTTERNQGNYHQGVEIDPWLRAFFSNICDRPSCHACKFRKRYRISDFTIWDCFQVGRYSKELDNDKGATRILIHSDKGRKIFEKIKTDFHYIETAPEAIMDTAKEMKESVLPNKRRKQFFEDANQLSGTELFEKYFPSTLKTKAEHFVRISCYKLGIYSIAKKVYVKLTGKY